MPEELKLLDEWSNTLGLKDWLITLETNVEPENMDIPDSDGCVSYEETTKAAKIQIVNPENRIKVEPGEKVVFLRPYDFETILVHELLHLKFCLLEIGDEWEISTQLRVLHQIIDDLARAFVDIKRGN